MRPLLIVAAAVVALAGCTPRETLMQSGLDFGRRYVWTKDGAGEVERNRAMIQCAEARQGELEELVGVASIPVVGLIALPAALPTERSILEGRVACMEREGWQLVDVMSAQPQRVTFTFTGPTFSPR